MEPNHNNGESETTASSSAAPRQDHHTTVEEELDADLPTGVSRETSHESAATKPQPPVVAPLDIQSDESFPSLGSASSMSKGKRPAQSTNQWAKSPPRNPPQMSTARATSNGGVNGAGRHFDQLKIPSGVSSLGMSPPSSGSGTPRAASPWIGAPRPVVLPGQQAQVTEKLDLPAGLLIPREQLKKPLAEVIKAIMIRTKTSIQVSTSATRITTFLIRGSPQNVAMARRDVAKELGARQTIAVPFPSSIRPLIIGKGGSTIQGISARHNVKIQMPKLDATSRGDESEEMEELQIDGDALGLQGAKAEIETIIGNRIITSNIKLENIPEEFFPFIAGHHESRVAHLETNRGVRMSVPAYERWTRPPPQQIVGERPRFQSTKGSFIQLTGERLAVQQAKQDIEQFVQTLHHGLSICQIPINRGRHQFITGPKGTSVHDFLEETSCAIILPPDNAPADLIEMITLIGPEHRLELASDKVLDLASSMHSVTIDASGVFANAPLGPQHHLSNVQRYLKQQGELEQLERRYESHIHIPDHGPWEVYSRGGRNTHLLRSELMNIMSGHPPARMTTVDIDPYYHQHLIVPQGEKLLSHHGVRAVLPTDMEEQSPTILLVFEGINSEPYVLPRKQPTRAEATQFDAALNAARQELLEAIIGRPSVVTRSVSAPPKHHARVHKLLKREQQKNPISGLPVRLRPVPAGEEPTNIVLQGTDADVEALTASILQMIAEEEADEKERGYTTSLPFPQAHMSQLVGRGGQRINKIRDEFEVEIQAKEGQVEIKGPKRRAEAAKAHIMGLSKQFADESRFLIKVKPQYHGELIGPRGQQINRLQDRYDVRIQFPRTTRQDQGNAETDSRSEAGSRTPRNLGPDEVEIRGPKRGAEQARSEILDLLQYITDNSYTASITIPAKFVPRVVGPQGREIDQIRLSTGAQIEVPKNKGEDNTNVDGKAEITIKGTKKSVEEARKILEEKAKSFNASTTRNLTIDRKLHGTLIGVNGNTIRDIVVNAGGPEDRRELAQIVRFPRAGSAESDVRVEGEKELVERIVKSLEEMVLGLKNQVTEGIEIAPEYHRILIGRGGDVRKGLEARFGVTINIPRPNAAGNEVNTVKVIGPKEKVADCKAEILRMVGQKRVGTVRLANAQHQALSSNGALLREMKSKYGVLVEYNGSKGMNSRPDASRQRNGGEGTKKQIKKEEAKTDMPLITDQNRSQDYAWELYVDVADAADDKASGPTNEEPTVTWTLKLLPNNSTSASDPTAHSPEEAIEQAKAAILAAADKVDASKPAGPSTNETTQPMATGYLSLDPSLHRSIIGPGGSTIEGLKKESRCRINVPKQGAEAGSAIEIRGRESDVLRCRQGILDVVRRS